MLVLLLLPLQVCHQSTKKIVFPKCPFTHTETHTPLPPQVLAQEDYVNPVFQCTEEELKVRRSPSFGSLYLLREHNFFFFAKQN